MARLARAEVFDPSEVAVLHLFARVVRRCFLFGVDPGDFPKDATVPCGSWMRKRYWLVQLMWI